MEVASLGSRVNGSYRKLFLSPVSCGVLHMFSSRSFIVGFHIEVIDTLELSFLQDNSFG